MPPTPDFPPMVFCRRGVPTVPRFSSLASRYVYIYPYMYICVYVYIYTYTIYSPTHPRRPPYGIIFRPGVPTAPRFSNSASRCPSLYVYLYMYTCIYIYLSIYVSMYLYIFLAIYLSIYLCIYLYIYLHINIHTYHFFLYRRGAPTVPRFSNPASRCPSLYIYSYMYTCISIYLSVYLSIYLSSYLFIYLSMYLFIHIYTYTYTHRPSLLYRRGAPTVPRFWKPASRCPSQIRFAL